LSNSNAAGIVNKKDSKKRKYGDPSNQSVPEELASKEQASEPTATLEDITAETKTEDPPKALNPFAPEFIPVGKITATKKTGKSSPVHKDVSHPKRPASTEKTEWNKDSQIPLPPWVKQPPHRYSHRSSLLKLGSLHDEILAFEHYIRIIVVHETLKFFRTHK
jgi:hypothetical protein